MQKRGRIIPFRPRQDFAAGMDKTTRWNFSSLVLDGICFAMGAAFLEANTVLPNLVSLLTSNSVIIGLASTIRNAGYLLPQLFVAGYAERLPFKKPLLRVNGIINRLSVLFMTLAIFLFSEHNPNLALTGLLLALGLFAFTDGIGGVPWTDMVAKSIPATRRGRLFATMQSLGGIGAFVAGFLIRQVLACFAFPMNYTILLLVGFAFMTVSLVGTMLVKEREGTVRHGSTMANYWRRLPSIWRSNPMFQQMMFTRMLMSCFYLALPFYIVFAREKLGFAESTVGLFLSAQMAGSILASLLWGHLGDKQGNRVVIRLVTLIAALTPGLALVASFMVRVGLANLAFLLCLLVFAAVGATLSGNWIGYTNYLLEVASDIDRPTYIGMMNTLTAPFTFLPIVGGALLHFTSHEVLFALTLLIVSGSVFMASRLPEPRTMVQVQPGQESSL